MPWTGFTLMCVARTLVSFTFICIAHRLLSVVLAGSVVCSGVWHSISSCKPGIHCQTENQGCDSCGSAGNIQALCDHKNACKKYCRVNVTDGQRLSHLLHVIILLKISMENILHGIDHFHHNNKNTDDNILAAEIERAVYNSEQHHQSAGNYPGKLVFGKGILLVQIRGLVCTDTVATYLEQQLGSGIAK